MRGASVLLVPLFTLLVSPADAQERRAIRIGEDLRQEIRQMIREEVRAAVRDALRDIDVRSEKKEKKSRATPLYVTKAGKDGGKGGTWMMKSGDSKKLFETIHGFPHGDGDVTVRVNKDGDVTMGHVKDLLRQIEKKTKSHGTEVGFDFDVEVIEDVEKKVNKLMKAHDKPKSVRVWSPKGGTWPTKGGAKVFQMAPGVDVMKLHGGDDVETKVFSFPGGHGKVMFKKAGDSDVQVFLKKMDAEHGHEHHEHEHEAHKHQKHEHGKTGPKKKRVYRLHRRSHI